MRRPFADGRDDAREIVVEQHHRGRLARDVGADFAHGHADVGALQRRRVVHAVARHRDELALRLKRLDDADLLLGIDARVHAQMPHAVRQLRVAQAGELASGDEAIVCVVGDSEPHGDRPRGERMVAGDHDGRHARLPALGHGARRFGARRIDQADEADEGKFPFYNRRGQLAG